MPTTGAETRELTDELKKRRVRFLLLQFTDLLGVNKAVEVPASQFEKALAGEVLFDGSALEGFARVEEADALLVPDLASFRVFPWESGAGGAGNGEAGGEGAVARPARDVKRPAPQGAGPAVWRLRGPVAQRPGLPMRLIDSIW